MRVLFADDDPAMQAVIKLALERVGGHQTCVCSSGVIALKEAPGFCPDVVLLDVNMPQMDGPTTLKAIRAIPGIANVPVIFLTADDHHSAESTFLQEPGVAGVIAKPFDPMKLSGTIEDMVKKIGPADADTPAGVVPDRLEALRRKYAEGLDDKIQRIGDAWEEFCRNGDSGGDHQTFQAFKLLVHSLSGSAGTFGFSELSEAARDLDLVLKTFTDRRTPLSKEEITLVGLRIDGLKDIFRKPVAGRCVTDTPAGTSSSAALHPPQRDTANRSIFVFGRSSLCTEELPAQIGYFGYEVQTFAEAGALLKALSEDPPAAVIADISSTDRSADIEAAGRVKEGVPGMPLIFISAEDDIATRLRLVRAGGDACFTRPVNIGKLIDKLDSLTMHKVAEPFRVLIVDDEPLLAAHHELVLKQAGIVTEIVTDPMQVLERLSDFRPELILMDVYMPLCNGLELAKIIRQKEAFISVPIVFLSAETDIDKQLSAMSLGGDDFLTKPISPAHLISSVTSRAERYRALRTFMVRDSLTGLLNHSRTKEQLDIEIARAERYHSGLSFALIDIDHFKLVNDRYGHYAGDQVLKGISRLLQQRLRKTDTIGRYGGEEFAVILAGMDGAGAAAVLDGIREDFGKILHQGKGSSFSVTFSCGIAAYSPEKTAIEISEEADEALYKAKNSGRNRIVISEKG